jgi:ATP-dependent protease ClpP protease subunit
MTYTIPIHGLIGIEEENEKSFMLSDLLLHLNNAKDFTSLHLDIDSNGGYCDVSEDMCKLIVNTGKFITSSNSGNVASAATPIFLLPTHISLRKFNPTKGEFLIHNPWTEVEGDAQYLAEVSKSLAKTENDYAKIYQTISGADVNIIKAFMRENTPLTPEQIESLGFATIVQNEFKAVAKLNLKTDTMTEPQLNEKFEKFEESFFSKIKALFRPKALMIADVNGKEIEYPEINDATEIKEGIAAIAEDDEYLQADGRIFVIKGNKIVEIKEPQAADDTEALKAELEALRAENESLKALSTEATETVEQVKAQAKEIENEFKNFKAQMTNFTPAKAATETKTKEPFNFKK